MKPIKSKRILTQLRSPQVIEITDYRAQLYDYLKNRMMAIAPNLTVMVGELVGARLISHAGESPVRAAPARSRPPPPCPPSASVDDPDVKSLHPDNSDAFKSLPHLSFAYGPSRKTPDPRSGPLVHPPPHVFHRVLSQGPC